MREPMKKDYSPFKIKCKKCKNKMRHSGTRMLDYEYKYTCDTCNYTIVITKQ